MNIGETLGEARQQAGLSRQEMSRRTKIPLIKIEALEQNAFEHLPAEFYLIGMVRAYAREAGIDPEPLVQHIRNGGEAPVSTPVVAMPPADQPLEVVATDERAGRSRRVFPAAIIAMFLGAFALGAYLVQYFGADDERVAATDDAPADNSAARAGNPATRPGRPGPVDPAVEMGAGMAGSIGTSGQNRAAPAAQPAVDTPKPSPSAAASAARQDFSGPWLLSTEVDSSSVATFEGLRLGYRVELRQEGNSISGTGHKVSENGRALGGSGQTPISVSGTVDGDRLTLIFVEHGARRPSKGTFALRGDGAGLWGRFSSDAARSAGTVEGRRS